MTDKPAAPGVGAGAPAVGLPRLEDWPILRDRQWDWHDANLVVRPYVDELVATLARLQGRLDTEVASRRTAEQAHEVDKHHLTALRQSAEDYAAHTVRIVTKRKAAEAALGSLRARLQDVEKDMRELESLYNTDKVSSGHARQIERIFDKWCQEPIGEEK
jgi:hypothetical protein